MKLQREKLGEYLIRGGLCLIALSLILFFLIFWPIIKNELKFIFSAKKSQIKVVFQPEALEREGDEAILPADENFSLIIPKIQANEKVVADVNPFNPIEYQKALKEGVAHARGSSRPGEKGNVFLFAHSSDNFYSLGRTNTVFFLLNKLEAGDSFLVVFEKKIFPYRVLEKKVVAAEAVEYLEKEESADQSEGITLMTCWPPGTDYRRLIVKGERAME